MHNNQSFYNTYVKNIQILTKIVNCFSVRISVRNQTTAMHFEAFGRNNTAINLI